MNKQGPLKAILDKGGLRNISADRVPTVFFLKGITILRLRCVCCIFFFHYNNIPPQVNPSGKRETRSVKDVVQHKLYAKKHLVNSGALLGNNAHILKKCCILCTETFVHRVDYMLGGFLLHKKGIYVFKQQQHDFEHP